MVYQRLIKLAAPRKDRRLGTGCQQRVPFWFNHPVDDPAGMGHSQRGHGRKRVQNVSHGAQTDHKQAKLGLSVQCLIFSQEHRGSPLYSMAVSHSRAAASSSISMRRDAVKMGISNEKAPTRPP